MLRLNEMKEKIWKASFLWLHAQQTHLECGSAAPLGSMNNTDIQIIKILCERAAYYIK